MAKNANLKNSVAQVVKTNGVKGITGANLQPTILQVIDKLGGGYQFGGLVQPNGTFPVDVNGNSLTDQNFAFLASTPGTYTNFGGLVVNEGEVCVFLWDGTWTKQVTGIITGSKMAEDYAKKVGSYAGLTAGISCGIADSISNGSPQQFTFRKSGGDGVNYMKRIKGRTLVWNQLVDFDTPGDTLSGVTFVNNGDGSISATGTNNGYGSSTLRKNLQVIGGHKYLVKGCPGGGSVSTYHLVDDVVGMYDETGSGVIFTASISATIGVGVKIQLNYSITGTLVFRPVLFDLTQMFGAGNEPSTVAEFEALYPKPYYDYNAGALISNDAVQVETVGFNLYNPETETANVIGGKAYYIGGTFTSISQNGVEITPVDGVFTPAETGTVEIVGGNATNTIINLSDPAKNGTYDPYWKRVLPLGLNSFRATDGTNIITVNGLKSAGSVYDEIDPVRKKYIKRVGSVDLGTLTWRYASDKTYPYFEYDLGDAPLNNTFGLIIPKYNDASIIYDVGVSYDDVYGRNYGHMRIRDTAYTNPTLFAASLSGVYAYYELATPVEYDLVDDIPNAILVDALGTEEAVFPEHEDGTPSAPFCCDSNYSISVKNLVAALAALNASLGGGE